MTYTFGLRFLHQRGRLGSKLTKVKAPIPRPRTIENINELPIELLVEIFIFSLPIGPITLPRPCIHEVPILLGRICSLWRSVSINTPQLWAQISIKLAPRTLENFHQFGIQEWLRRSGNCPLSFKIPRHDRNHIIAPSLTLTLQAEANRWRCVSLEDNCTCIRHILETLWTPGKTPMLTYLHLFAIPLVDWEPPEITTPVHCASQLNSFSCSYSWGLRLLRMGKFDALRELRINLFVEGDSLTFSQIPVLKILEIECLSLPRQYETTPEVHTLQHLHTFIFFDSKTEMNYAAHAWLLDEFDTPALNSLAIISPRLTGDRQGEGTHVSDFLRRCGGRLQRLTLLFRDIKSCTGSALSGFTQHTPMLETLCTEYHSGLLLVDLTTCSTLSQIDIMDDYHFGAGRSHPDHTVIRKAVSAILSQWKVSRLEKRSSSISPSIIRVPRHRLSQVLEHRAVKQCIRKGLCVRPLPSGEEFWWNSVHWRMFLNTYYY